MNYLLHMMRARTWIYILIAAILGLFSIYRFTAHTNTKNNEVKTATSTSIAIENSITAVGSVTPIQKADIGFKRSGIIMSLSNPVGTHVTIGTLLGTLDTAEYIANLVKAKSDALAARADRAKATTLLTNYENQKEVAINQAYAKAEDAVRRQLNPLFMDSDTTPYLTFKTKDSQVENDIYIARVAAGRSLIAWQKNLPHNDITDAIKRLTDIRTLFYLAQNAINQNASLDSATLATYKTAIIAGLDALHGALLNTTDLAQKIRTQETEIQASDTRVASADASVEQAQVRLNESYLRAPFTGIITDKKIEVGEFISAGQTAFSIAGDIFELQSDIPEAYISKIQTDMPVSIILDAYANETIAGTITSIEPAGRPINDVIYYRIKIHVDNTLYRAFLKNGLTANITIKQ